MASAADKIGPSVDKTPPRLGCVSSVDCVTGGNTENPRSAVETWTAADWQVEYDERAAIHEFDGHRPRPAAERMAWNHVAALWYRHHGKRVQGALCAGCGELLNGTDGADILLLPHGERAHVTAGAGGYSCIERYGMRWKRAAAAALARMGIRPPAEKND
jgi:hypothetical protein